MCVSSVKNACALRSLSKLSTFTFAQLDPPSRKVALSAVSLGPQVAGGGVALVCLIRIRGLERRERVGVLHKSCARGDRSAAD